MTRKQITKITKYIKQYEDQLILHICDQDELCPKLECSACVVGVKNLLDLLRYDNKQFLHIFKGSCNYRLNALIKYMAPYMSQKFQKKLFETLL